MFFYVGAVWLQQFEDVLMYNLLSCKTQGRGCLVHCRKPCLFTWREVEATSELDRFLLVKDRLPDTEIVQGLKRRRGKGRNDYPVVAMWNALLAGVVFQHTSMASLLRELRRNAGLRELCGFDPTLGAAAVPDEHNMSRFLGNAIELEPLIQGMFQTLAAAMGEVLPNGVYLSQ